MHKITAALGAVLLLAGSAQAATVTIDFDELGDPNFEGFGGKVGNVNYYDQNRYLYSYFGPSLMLGDDGFSSSTTFTADPGTTFTPLSFDLGGRTNLARVSTEGLSEEEIYELTLACDVAESCTGAEFFGFDNVSITGYLAGTVVAQDFVGGPNSSYGGLYQFSSAFADIDTLSVDILSRPASGLEPGYIYTCGMYFFSGCVSGDVDNFTVEVASVPLPAALPSLAAGLSILGLVARRRRMLTSPA